MLTTLLGFLADPLLLERHRDRAEGILRLFLLLQTGMLGVFMSLDFFLFYVFWEVMLVPMYFIIGVWGGAAQALRRHQVLPLHPGRLGADAAGHPDALLPALQPVSAVYTFDISDADEAAACRLGHCSSGCSGRSSSASPSRCRCSRSTPGCPTRTSKRPRPAR